MLKEIIFVPIRQKDQLVTSISKFAQLEANILKTKYKLIIAGTYEDWQVEGVEYTNTVFTTKDYALGGWSERWNQLAKYVNNDRLFYFHSPFPCLEFYNHTFVKGVIAQRQQEMVDAEVARVEDGAFLGDQLFERLRGLRLDGQSSVARSGESRV